MSQVITLGQPISTPHFNAVLVFGPGLDWPVGQDRGTHYFTLNDTRSTTRALAGQIAVQLEVERAIEAGATGYLLKTRLCRPNKHGTVKPGARVGILPTSWGTKSPKTRHVSRR